MNLESARQDMLDRQLAGRGLRDPAVLEAMRRVPREAFVPAALRASAYDDTALPIGEGQTLSQPWIVALMIEAAGIRPGDRVLEIGTGSGYAAAVAAALATRVDTVERRPALAARARATLERLGCGNVRVHVGDGTLGWPDGAPYDVILAAAGGPDVPAPWRAQLAQGGRLVMPVGMTRRRQRLVRLVRDGDEYDEQNLGQVRFVPLIGRHGWSDRDEAPARARCDAPPMSLPQCIARAAEPLPAPDAADFGAHFDRYAGRRLVLVGEATHGSAEFYRARAAITRRLIEAHGCRIVAIEGDWPDVATLDRYVRGKLPTAAAATPFTRFPTWMWRNADMADFLGWLRRYNRGRPEHEQAGLYGLDMYSLAASITAVLDYLERVDPAAAAVARERYGCLSPWQEDPADYGRAALDEAFRRCEQAVLAQLRDLLDKRIAYAAREGGASYLDAAQNARLVAAAERYYRAMYHGATESWNLRDTHMADTLQHVLEAHGADARATVWAHNSHVGDARATESGERDRLSLGQLCRERFGAGQVLIVGMGTHAGTVAAASRWGGSMEIKQVLPSRPDSYGRLMHDSALPRFALDLRDGAHPALRERLAPPRLERYIGVIYRPESELHSHYLDVSLPAQYDVLLWFDHTRAVTALPARESGEGADTFPSGL